MPMRMQRDQRGSSAQLREKLIFRMVWHESELSKTLDAHIKDFASENMKVPTTRRYGS